MEEIWKDIENYEGEYQVSNMGRIKSLKGAQATILSLIDARGRYYKVNLYHNGQMKTYMVHRLVAQAFIDNPQGLRAVNHKDENGHNNCADNLEWCDVQYNNTYGTRIDRAARTHSRPVWCEETQTLYANAVEAGAQLNIGPRLIRGVCMGEHHSTHGYHFIYKNKEES